MTKFSQLISRLFLLLSPLLLLIIWFFRFETALAAGLQINTNGQPRAEKIKTQLLALVKKYDLSPFIYTTRINIVPKVIPHSHPVLTLNTLWDESPNRLLSSFVHEQFHWYAEMNPKAVQSTTNAFRRKFPNPPVDPKQVAADENS